MFALVFAEDNFVTSRTHSHERTLTRTHTGLYKITTSLMGPARKQRRARKSCRKSWDGMGAGRRRGAEAGREGRQRPRRRALGKGLHRRTSLPSETHGIAGPQAHWGRVQVDTFRWIWMRGLGLQVQHELNSNSSNNTKHVLFWVLYTHLHLVTVHPHNSSPRRVLWIRALFKWGNYGTERLSTLLNFAQHGNAGTKAQFRQSPEACGVTQSRTQRTGEQGAHQVNDDLTRPEQGLPQAWKPHSTWRCRGPEATELTLVTRGHRANPSNSRPQTRSPAHSHPCPRRRPPPHQGQPCEREGVGLFPEERTTFRAWKTQGALSKEA